MIELQTIDEIPFYDLNLDLGLYFPDNNFFIAARARQKSIVSAETKKI